MVSPPLPSFAGPSRHAYPAGQFAFQLCDILRWMRFGHPEPTLEETFRAAKAERDAREAENLNLDRAKGS